MIGRKNYVVYNALILIVVFLHGGSGQDIEGRGEIVRPSPAQSQI